jgi:hypothetical protein
MNLAFNTRVFLIPMDRSVIARRICLPFGRPVFVLAMVAWLAALPAKDPPLRLDFITPNFSKTLFDMDSVFLEPGELREVTNALSALAANFPGDSRIDNRIRAKALAISLRLDGTHRDSVLTLQKLQLGEKPDSVPSFNEPDAAALRLWKLAEALDRADASRDDHVLACYLMDIAMLIDPDHPGGRVRLKELSRKGKFLGWKDVIVEMAKPPVKPPAAVKPERQDNKDEKVKDDNKAATVDRVPGAENSQPLPAGQGGNPKQE